MNHRQRRPRGWALAGATAAIIAIAVAGCAEPPSGDVMFGGIGRSAGAPPLASTGRLNGLYVGSAAVELNGNLSCPERMPITNFQVVNDAVSFGAFHGPIQPDGSVTLRAQGMMFNGHFNGAEFDGRVDTTMGPEFIMRPLRTCIYAIRVHRASA